MKNTTIISLGGSVIIPDQINTKFLAEFRKMILKKIKSNHRFFIIIGGGKTARRYQAVADKISGLTRDDLDWLGIHSTVLNGHLLRTIFRKIAYKKIINDSRDMQKSFKEKVIIASGWTPGWSTDYIATKIAEKYGINNIINISNIDYVYTKDPRKHKDAKPIKRIGWKDFRKIVGNKWAPGLNAPFDPVASKLAQKLDLEVAIVGSDIANLGKCIDGKEFKGTVINDK
ncbi:UMP kinase [Patescibacteria group bacterium]